MRALDRRPTTLERWPKGVHPGIVLSTRERGGGDAFFQKRVPRGAPDYVQTARIEFPSGRHADEICPTEIAVVGWAAQMGTITFHPWPVRRDDVDHPDELRIDLDPQPGTDFADAVRVAGEARALLDELGYVGFPKTSGGRGVHIYVRIEPRWTFTDVRHAAIAFGRELERRLPGEVTTKWWKEERGERIFVDYNQNARDRTIASAYSVRPKPGAPGLGAAGLGRARRRRRPRTSPSRRCRRGSPRSAIATPRSTTSPTRCSRCWTCTSSDAGRGRRRHALPAGLPEDAGRAEARAALARPRPPAGRAQRRRERVVSATAAAWPRRAGAGADGGGTTGPMSPSGRLVEVDDHRGVVARAAALAGLPVDPGRPDTLGDRRRRRAPDRSASRGPGGTSRPGSPSR